MRHSRDIARTAETAAGRASERGAATASARRAGACVALAACCLATTGAALARPVTFPKDDPKLVLEVPDDLAVAYTALGLEITSPDKKLFMVADIQPRERAEADAWAHKATKKLQAFGVSFDRQPATDPARPPAQAAPQPKQLAPEPAAVAKASPGPAASPSGVAGRPPSVAGAPAQIDRSAPTFTFMEPGDAAAKPAPAAPAADPAPVFSGAPSLATPAKPDVSLAVRTDVPAGANFTTMALPATGSGPKIPFKAGHFSDTTLDGAPIDVELVDFGLSRKQLFLVLQASFSNDDRAAEILKSVKPAR